MNKLNTIKILKTKEDLGGVVDGEIVEVGGIEGEYISDFDTTYPYSGFYDPETGISHIIRIKEDKVVLLTETFNICDLVPGQSEYKFKLSGKIK